MNIELIQNINISFFDTSFLEKKYLASYENRHFEISEPTARFIAILKKSESIHKVAEELSSSGNRNYTEEDVLELYKKCVVPIIENKKTNKDTVGKKGMFLWKTSLIPDSVIDKCLCFTNILFNKPVIIIMIGIILISEVIFFMTDLSISFGHIDIYIILGILSMYICSSLFHELGHATACRFYGAEQRGIGIGIYLNLPAFYTDVSDIWKLTRKQRMVVNFSGVYFQLIFLIPIFSIYFITHNEILKYFILTVNLNLIFTLNPFFKFDGYWIMTDLLGIPNLRDRSKDLFSYLIKHLRHKTIGEKPILLKIRSIEKISLIIYSIVVNFFFVYYFCYILPRFLTNFYINFPNQFYDCINQIAVGIFPSLGLIISICIQLTIFCLMIFFIYKIVKPLLYKIIRHNAK